MSLNVPPMIAFLSNFPQMKLSQHKIAVLFSLVMHVSNPHFLKVCGLILLYTGICDPPLPLLSSWLHFAGYLAGCFRVYYSRVRESIIWVFLHLFYYDGDCTTNNNTTNNTTTEKRKGSSSFLHLRKKKKTEDWRRIKGTVNIGHA